jgi:hypothetical protein
LAQRCSMHFCIDLPIPIFESEAILTDMVCQGYAPLYPFSYFPRNFL